MVLCRCTLLLILVLSSAAAALAQPASVAGPESPVSLGVVGGLSAGAGNGGAAIGGAIGGVVSDRVSLEGRAVYMDRGPGSDALDVNASLLVNLLLNRRAIPYLAVGGGIYRASFDLDNHRFLGMMGNLPPGTLIVPTADGWAMMGARDGHSWNAGWRMGDFRWNGAAWSGPQYRGGQMPMFYANRLGAMEAPEDGAWGRRAFTDPAVSFGGGVRLDLTESMSVRPDARALLVVAGGDTFTIGSFSLSLAYRF